jgi:hypothetical protein
MKILFITKKRNVYNDFGDYTTLNSGLYNSASFICDALKQEGWNTKLVDVIDNNSIDREVSIFKPSIVIIEALWVVPEKFEILQKLHPKVKWIIRLHSNIPFLANEGNAISWLKDYSKYKNVYIACNHPEAKKAVETIIDQSCLYMPNYYPVKKHYTEYYNAPFPDYIINIGCFGSIRPLKNHLQQAIAAIEFCNERDIRLYFHINSSRVEGKAEGVLKNLRSLFKGTKHKLVEHPWLDHREFLYVVSLMDLGMQVSFSETFNIVAADFVNMEVPVVTSDQIEFINCFALASPTNVESIKKAMKSALKHPWLHTRLNKRDLISYSNNTLRQWNYTLNRFTI